MRSNTINKHNRSVGFTLIELVIVISVIGILAAIGVVSYNGWSKATNIAQMKSDLNGISAAMENARNFSNTYPSSFPSTFTPSNGTVLQFATAGTGNFCINAYNPKYPELLMSYDSKVAAVQQSLCSGLTIGNPIGGTVPTAPRNVNLVPGFSNWTLTGGATFNQTTGELILGAGGLATSPMVRVDKPNMIYVGGDLYATIASVNSSLAPNGGWHTGISYFAADGTTPVYNSWNYMSNGCAPAFTLNAWSINNRGCGYGGGPNVVYVRYAFNGSNYGYASSDLKIKNPLVIGQD